MQLVANKQLVRNRVRLGGGLYAVSLGVFLLGLVVTRPADEAAASASLVASYATIGIGMVLWLAAMSQLRRWGPRQKQEQVLADAISDLDDRYKLYAFLSSQMPEYVLVGPAGVHVLVVKNERGRITCSRDRWRKAGQHALFAAFDPPLGNPSAAAQDGIRKVRQVLEAAGLSDVPVAALVVFVHDKAQLQVEGCTTPVVKLRTLKDALLRASGRGKHVALTAARVREVRAIFDRQMQAARAWR